MGKGLQKIKAKTKERIKVFLKRQILRLDVLFSKFSKTHRTLLESRIKASDFNPETEIVFRAHYGIPLDDEHPLERKACSVEDFERIREIEQKAIKAATEGKYRK